MLAVVNTKAVLLLKPFFISVFSSFCRFYFLIRYLSSWSAKKINLKELNWGTDINSEGKFRCRGAGIYSQREFKNVGFLFSLHSLKLNLFLLPIFYPALYLAHDIFPQIKMRSWKLVHLLKSKEWFSSGSFKYLTFTYHQAWLGEASLVSKQKLTLQTNQTHNR